jgi:hypothetical protein
MIEQSEAALTELITLATRHTNLNMLSQFALSRKTQSLLDEASKSFIEATDKLQLGLSVAQYGVQLKIDENISVLIRYKL